jgi:hypothetical protein
VNFAVLAEGFTEQDGGWGGTIGDDRDVHVDIISQLASKTKHNIALYMPTNPKTNPGKFRTTIEFTQLRCGTSG